MRTTLLTSAAVFAFTYFPAMAQTASPAPTPPAATTDQAPPSTEAPDASQPPAAHPHHMHRARQVSDDRSSSAGPWAHQPGTGESGPASSKASNIDPADSRSDIAPHLPSPGGGPNASPQDYLREANSALGAHQTGLAQQALEMAETRLLDRSTLPDAANQPDQSSMIKQVTQARDALGHGDVSGARSAIQTALAGTSAPPMAGGDMGTEGQASPSSAASPPPPSGQAPNGTGSAGAGTTQGGNAAPQGATPNGSGSTGSTTGQGGNAAPH
jgi:hypothetical protein